MPQKRIPGPNGRADAVTKPGMLVEKCHKYLPDATACHGVPRNACDRLDNIAKTANLMILMRGGLTLEWSQLLYLRPPGLILWGGRRGNTHEGRK